MYSRCRFRHLLNFNRRRRSPSLNQAILSQLLTGPVEWKLANHRKVGVVIYSSKEASMLAIM